MFFLMMLLIAANFTALLLLKNVCVCVCVCERESVCKISDIDREMAKYWGRNLTHCMFLLK